VFLPLGRALLTGAVGLGRLRNVVLDVVDVAVEVFDGLLNFFFPGVAPFVLLLSAGLFFFFFSPFGFLSPLFFFSPICLFALKALFLAFF